MNYRPLIAGDLPYRTHIGPDWKGSLHWHSEMELFLSLRGQHRVELENQVYHLSAGDAMILPGYAAHSVSSSVTDNCHVAINFGYGLLKNRYPAIQNACVYLPADADHAPAGLRHPINMLLEIFRADGKVTEENEWQIRGNLFLLCNQLLTIAPEEPATADLQDRIRMLDNIFAVIRHVEKHYSQRITVEDMSTLAGYAKTYFCRQFKRITGVPFYHYLTRYRIQAACLLLETPVQSIASVAEASGFSTQSLFCRAFKECTGITPSQYQQLSEEERTFTWMD